MNILMHNYEFPPLGGGAGVACRDLLKELSKYEDISIDLVTSSSDKYSVEHFSKNITVHYLDIGKNGRNLHFQKALDLIVFSSKSYFYSRKLMKTKIYDAVHAFFGIPCGFIAMLLGKKFIVSLRGSDVPFHNPRFKLADRLIFRHLSRIVWGKALYVVANSEHLAESAAKTCRDKFYNVIYNGVNITDFTPGNDSRDDGVFRFLYTGRLNEIKGVDYLFEAFNVTLKDMINRRLELWVAGEGNMKKELEKFADRKNISRNVRFLNKVPHEELPAIYRQCDVFVLPSLNEGMPMSLIEAMASGIGIICTDIPFLKVLIENEINGYIVPRKDYKAMAEAMKKYVLKGKGTVKAHGIVSRRKSEAYMWSSSAEKYVNLYRSAVL